jgi:adenylate cyclase
LATGSTSPLGSKRWRSRAASARVQEDAAGKLDLPFNDIGEHSLKNIARPIRVYRVAGDITATATNRASLPLLDKPSVAVLPFQNTSGDPEQEYFADGMVEDITAALCRVRDFFVIARNSAFSYKGRAVPVQQISRELGVRYLIEGSVRITAQLIDGPSGNHLWADRYEGGMTDIFDLQDRITESVVGAIQPSVRSAEIERSRRKRPESLDAYDFVLRAYPDVWSLERGANAEALKLLDQALRSSRIIPWRSLWRRGAMPASDLQLGRRSGGRTDRGAATSTSSFRGRDGR